MEISEFRFSEAVMKGRLNQAIWTLVAVNAIAIFAVLYFAYEAGRQANGLGMADVMSATGKTPTLFFVAAFLCVATPVLIWIRLSNKVAKPVNDLVDYSHKFAAGDYNSRPQIDSNDDFGLIAENFTRSSERISR